MRRSTSRSVQRWSTRYATARSARTRLEDAAGAGVARLRGGLARTRSLGFPAATDAANGVGRAADGVGLAAARRAVRTSGPPAALSRPLIIEVEPLENIAAVRGSRGGWGRGRPPSSVRRVNAGDGDAAVILAAAAGRSLVAVVRDAHRDANTLSLVDALLAARPDTVLVEMGLPGRWQPPGGYLPTWPPGGASRASAQAACRTARAGVAHRMGS